MSRVDLYLSNSDFAVVTGACPHDCPDTCSWQVAVERSSGRAVDIWGHAEHPITQGRLCGKVDRYLERTYHAGRLTTPLRCVGPKGSGQFEPVGWDEAIAAIAGRLRAIVGEYGAEAVLPYSYSGTLGFLQGEGMATRFFNRLGASRLARTICSEAGFEGYLYTMGAAEGMLPEDFAHARLILIWGSNTLTSNQHLWPFVQAARKAGGRVLVIDPANTRTAQAADEWIPIRPGTDGALALAMMHVIIGEGLHDADYVQRYTLGFEQLATRVAEWAPTRAAEITGVPAERIVALAREYATTRPAAIRINYGLQRHYGGGMAVRTITCLPALIGAWSDHGGGIQLSSSGMFRHLEKSGLYAEGGEQRSIVNGQLSMVNEEDPGSPLAPRPSPLATPRTINMNRLGDALSLDPAVLARAHYRPRPVDRMPAPEEAGPPVMALIVYNSNPAAVTPDQPAVLAGLRRDDLFTVVLENFQTDTADYADYILPATTQLEHWDIHRSYGHAYLSLNRPAIAPLGEALPNSEIFRRLAAALGFADPCFAETDEEILRAFVAAQTHARFAGLTWERLLADGFYRVNVPDPYLPFAAGNFPTPSGKCEFYSARMAGDGYDPLPAYTAPKWQEDEMQRSMVNGQLSMVNGEGADSPLAPRPSQLATSDSPLAPRPSPLVCISPPAHSFLNTTFANIPRFLQREAEPLLHIHPDDAALRRVETGDRVRVCNAQGEVTLTAQVTGDIIPGTVLAPGVWWAKFSPDGRNINQVTPADETDMGASGMFYDAVVWVEVVA